MTSQPSPRHSMSRAAPLLRLLAAAPVLRVAVAASAAVGASTQDLGVSPSALATDDECLAGKQGNSGCALNALQFHGLRTAAATAEAGSEEGAPRRCNVYDGKKACPRHLTCISTTAGDWAQCVDCSRRGFLKDCMHMPEEFKAEASKQCGRTCPYTTPPPPAKCNATIPCPKHQECVSTTDGNWSQCISCRGKKFQEDCQKLDKDMRYRAVRTCKRTCLDTNCENDKRDSWCPGRRYTCITDGEGWGQCVRCDKKTFTYTCSSWTPKMKARAQRKCHKKCHR